MSSSSDMAYRPAVPVVRTSLVGRSDELTQAQHLLLGDGVPLVTLTGPGGVGKTRLGLAIAHTCAAEFADGAVFVDLAPIRNPELVLSTIAECLGVRESSDRPIAKSLWQALRSQQLLLVLDNFEQVIDAAPNIADLLTACPALQVLVTSRAPLRLQGEHLLSIPPLAVPPVTAEGSEQINQAEAVQLFVQRARAADPTFRLTDANAATVAELCVRLDGLPLALELAAGRLRSLSSNDLLALLADRLRLLSEGERDRPLRHRALHEAIDWSYQLLPAREQALFRRLSVGSSGFGIDTAAGLTGLNGSDIAMGITRLSDQSLLRRLGGSTGTHWTMLETIREFGLEQTKLQGEWDASHLRLFDWCVQLVESAWPPRRAAAKSLIALQRLDAEQGNLRIALTWAIAGNHADKALRLSADLAEYWWLRGTFTEGYAWLERSLALDGGTPRLRASALYGASGLRECLGDPETALAHAQESLALARAHGDDLDILRAEHQRNGLTTNPANPSESLGRSRQTFARAQALADPLWLGYATIGLGYMTFRAGEVEAAAGLLKDAADLFNANTDPWGEMNAVFGLGIAHSALGEHDAARDAFLRTIEVSQQIASPWGTLRGLIGVAGIWAADGDVAPAARLLGAIAALSTQIGPMVNREGEALREDAVARSRERLGAERFSAQWNRGRDLTMAAAIDVAMSTARDVDADSELSDASLPLATTVTPALHSFRLSPRETEILALLCQRFTNPEIAEQLFLSVRTVTTHVASIFNKLGVNSRRDAAALAARLGLV